MGRGEESIYGRSCWQAGGRLGGGLRGGAHGHAGKESREPVRLLSRVGVLVFRF